MDTSDLQIEQDRVIEQMRKQLANMSATEINKKATKQRIVDSELKNVLKVTRSAAKKVLGNDRMQASKGVRMVKYKSVFGGNINILTGRGSVQIDSSIYNRQGRRYRSERSRLIASYYGASRSFVLRWTQAGTQVRTAGSKGNSRGGSGNRGAILAKDFMSTAVTGMSQAADNIVRHLGFLIQEGFMQD